MGESITVTCPYCLERLEVWIEVDLRGECVMDCAVCCHPWRVVVSHGEQGPVVEVERSN